MPVYTYRREDGTTFEIRQKFSDNPLTVDPETGQAVTRVIQAAGIVFRGSGFYVNDSKSSKANLSSTSSKSDTNTTTKTDAPAAKSDEGSKSEPLKKSDEPAAD